MKKFILLPLVILSLTLVLFSCKKGDIEIPDGLQIVNVSKSDGFQFFGPEGWIVANEGPISASCVSAINNTSITFAEAEMPEGEIGEYFEKEREKFAYEITVLEEKEDTFGNAEWAYSYVYTFKYQQRDFAALQMFIKNAGKFYIFTYTSYGDPTSESSEYQNYLEVVRLSIDSFKFTEVTEGSAPTANYPKDADGFVMVSDPDLSGFELYLPEECEVVISSAQVSAKFSENANITITKATSTGVSILSYLKTRKAELEAIFGKVTDIKIELATLPDLSGDNADMFSAFDVTPTENKGLTFGNLDNSRVISYEYSYEYLGTTYRVYQILGVNSYNGYVLTYTATEGAYEEHLDSLTTVIKKVKF